MRVLEYGERGDISMTILSRAQAVYDRIQKALAQAGRKDNVDFTAVSKTRTVNEMHEAEAVSFIDYFGENRVQEGEAKRRIYGSSRLTWRFIGHLQANKVRKALEFFDTIDSIDSIDLAHRVDRTAGEMGKVIPILIEVNTSGEASKSGISPENFSQLLDNVLALQNIRLDGLMTIGPITDNDAQIRKAFALLRVLIEGARTYSGLSLPILSMGMSGDFEAAILEGSTMVRIGTLLFGEREYKKIPPLIGARGISAQASV